MDDAQQARTHRGFTVYDRFYDSYGHEIVVQQSGNATLDAVWVFARRNEHVDSPGFEPSPHLDVAQATRLRDALGVFIREYSGDPQQ